MAVETINQRIKNLRLAARLSQAELASTMGIAQKTMSMIERGEITPTIRHIETLHNFFGVSADYLIFGVDSMAA